MAQNRGGEFLFPNGLRPDQLRFGQQLEPEHGVRLRALSEQQLRALYVEAGQRLQLIEDPSKHVEFRLPKLPAIIFGAGDFHFGSWATNYDLLREFRDIILQWDGAYLILLGDEVDGRGKYSTSDVRTIPVQQQIKYFRDWLRPLYDAGKIICGVGEYDGHVGWIVDKEGGMSWRDLFGDMEIPVVGNGRLLRLLGGTASGVEVDQDIAIAHNAGGRSKVDPVHGLRNLVEQGGATMAFAGHTHAAGMASETAWISGTEGMQVQRKIYVNSGTAKGVATPGLDGKDQVLDSFGVRHAWGEPSPLGSGVTIYAAENQLLGAAELKGIPFLEPEAGLLVYAAIRFLEMTEAQGLTEEILGELRDPRKRTPKKLALAHILPQSISRVGQSPLEEQRWNQAHERAAQRLQDPDAEVEVPREEIQSDRFTEPYASVYRRLVLRFDPDELPFAIHPISNTRLGVANFRQKEFESYLSRLKNPWDLALWLRGIVDDELGGLSNRMEYLEQARGWFQGTADRNVALLIDGALRRHTWKRMAGGMSGTGGMSVEDMKKYGPVAPASFLSRQAGIPLLANQGLLEMRIGHTRHWSPLIIGAMDKLRHSGSLTKPLWGLTQAYLKFFQESPMVVVGGHMPGSGFGKLYDPRNPNTKFPLMVAPGWWSEVNTVGKGNIIDGGPPEYSIIVAPYLGKLLTYVTQGRSEYELLINALTLQLGAIKDPKILRARTA